MYNTGCEVFMEIKIEDLRRRIKILERMTSVISVFKFEVSIRRDGKT
jgi:hypothetical protein